MKIVFFSADPGNHKFISPIIERLEKDGHECLIALNWTIVDAADVYWFDFCDNNLIVATRENKEELMKKKVIARLHAVEYYMSFHKQIDWSCVDELIYVSGHMLRLCDIPWSQVNQSVIHNGIDLEKFTPRKKEVGKVLGYAGNIVPTKGILTMLHYFNSLLDIDDSYQLKMVGLSRFSGREGEYFEYYKQKLGNSLEQSDEVSDINAWLDGIDYLWQPSYAESFSLIVGEAMAKGIKPIINDFYGSRELWPQDCIYESFENFIGVLHGPYTPELYRSYARKYSLDNQMEKIKELL